MIFIPVIKLAGSLPRSFLEFVELLTYFPSQPIKNWVTTWSVGRPLSGQACLRDGLLEERVHGVRNTLARADLKIEAGRRAGLHVRGHLAREGRNPRVVPSVGRERQVRRIEHSDLDAAVLQRGAVRHVQRLLAADVVLSRLR